MGGSGFCRENYDGSLLHSVVCRKSSLSFYMKCAYICICVLCSPKSNPSLHCTEPNYKIILLYEKHTGALRLRLTTQQKFHFIRERKERVLAHGPVTVAEASVVISVCTSIPKYRARAELIATDFTFSFSFFLCSVYM